MRILHVTPSYPPYVGGLEYYVSTLVNIQRRLGHNVEVITSNPSVNVPSESNVIRLPILFKVKLISGDIPVCPSIFIALRQRERARPDVIHIHTPPKFFAEAASLFRLFFLKKTPLVLSYHLHNQSLRAFEMAVLNAHNRFVGRQVFKCADAIVVPTATYRKIVHAVFKIDLDKIKVVPYGIDTELFDPSKYSKEEERQNFNLHERKVMLFVGRLVKSKGVDYLIKAFPQIRNQIHDVSLVIVGTGNYRCCLESLSKKLDLTSCVRFIGGIPHEDVPKIMALADILVLPSLTESFGIVLAEAMAMRKPVVAFNVGGIRDVLAHAKTGFLVDGKNIHELSRAILTILLDDKLASDMGRLGREIVREKYSWDVATQKTLKIYEEALRNHNN